MVKRPFLHKGNSEQVVLIMLCSFHLWKARSKQNQAKTCGMKDWILKSEMHFKQQLSQSFFLEWAEKLLVCLLFNSFPFPLPFFLFFFPFVRKHWNQKDLCDTRPDQAWGRICSFQLSASVIIKTSRCTLHMSFLLNSFRSFSINLLLFLFKSQGSHNRGWSAKAILAQAGNSENYLGSRILLSRHQNSLWTLLWAPPAWKRP